MLQSFGEAEIGSVKALPSVTLKMDANGVLFAKGPNIMTSYYNNPDASREAKDGWLDTGDMVTIDDEGFVTIVDEKNRYWYYLMEKCGAFTNEEAIKRSPYVAQV